MFLLFVFSSYLSVPQYAILHCCYCSTFVYSLPDIILLSAIFTYFILNQKTNVLFFSIPYTMKPQLTRIDEERFLEPYWSTNSGDTQRHLVIDALQIKWNSAKNVMILINLVRFGDMNINKFQEELKKYAVNVIYLLLLIYSRDIEDSTWIELQTHSRIILNKPEGTW